MFAPLAAAANFIDTLQSDRYEAVSLSSRWVPANPPKPISDHRDFPRCLVPPCHWSVKVKDFISVYGVPSAVLRPKVGGGSPYLVYALPDGYKIIVFLVSLDSDNLMAAGLFDPQGKEAGPILK